MKHEINLPRVYSGKFPLGKSIFSRAKVHSVTSTIVGRLSANSWPTVFVMFEAKVLADSRAVC